MPNAKHTIKASENNEGKVIINLYGQLIDVTKKVKDGKATVKLFGNDYDIVVARATKKPAKKIKVTGKSETHKPEIKFIKTKIK